jgi:hypothetical protein
VFDKKYQKAKGQSQDKKQELLNRLKIKSEQKQAEIHQNIPPLDQTIIKQKDKIIQELKKKLATRETDYQKEFANNRQKFSTYEREIKDLHQTIRMKNEKIHYLTQENANLPHTEPLDTKTINNLEHLISKQLQKEVSGQLARLTQKNVFLLNEINRLNQEKNQEMNQRVEQLSQDIRKIGRQQKHLQIEAVTGTFNEIKDYKNQIQQLKTHKKDLERNLKISQGELTLFKEEIKKGGLIRTKNLTPPTIISWLTQALTPSNWQQYETLTRLTQRYNHVVDESEVVDIWTRHVGVIRLIDGVCYLRVEGKNHKVTDENGFLLLKDGQKFEATIQKFSGATRLHYRFSEEEVIDAKIPSVKKATYEKQITPEDLENERLLTKALKDRRILLVSWHNMGSYVGLFKKYGAKVKVLDSKKHDKQITDAMFSKKYDLTYLFINGVDHGTYWATMKKFKSYDNPPQRVRLTFKPNPEEVLNDAFMTLVGTQKRSALAVLASGFSK